MGSKRVIKHGADSTRQHNSRFLSPSFCTSPLLNKGGTRLSRSVLHLSLPVEGDTSLSAQCLALTGITYIPINAVFLPALQAHPNQAALIMNGHDTHHCFLCENLKGWAVLEGIFFLFFWGVGGGCYRVCAELHVSVISALQSTV